MQGLGFRIHGGIVQGHSSGLNRYVSRIEGGAQSKTGMQTEA